VDKNPVVSVIATSVRPKNWLRIHENLSSSKVPFEMVFVGDEKPDFKLPKNFKYIYTKVKPCQCSYIAYLYSSGQYILNSADDFTYSAKALDYYVKTMEKYDKEENVVLGASFGREKKADLRFFGSYSKYYKKEYMPMLVCGIFTRKESIELLGGFERRFICGYWDVDILMRTYEAGGVVKVCDNVSCFEDKKEPGMRQLPKKFVKYHDRDMFYGLWTVETKNVDKRFTPDDFPKFTTKQIKKCKLKVMKTRSVVAEPFENRDDILKISQSNKGTWE